MDLSNSDTPVPVDFEGYSAYMESGLISGIMQRVNLAGFMVSSVAEQGWPGEIFKKLAENQINIEFANQIINKKDYNSIILCVDSKDTYSALALLEEVRPKIKAREIRSLKRVGILSLFPHREHALISSIIIQTLFSAEIPVFAMGSSISVISCVVNEEKITDAIRHMSKKFGLS